MTSTSTTHRFRWHFGNCAYEVHSFLLNCQKKCKQKQPIKIRSASHVNSQRHLVWKNRSSRLGERQIRSTIEQIWSGQYIYNHIVFYNLICTQSPHVPFIENGKRAGGPLVPFWEIWSQPTNNISIALNNSICTGFMYDLESHIVNCIFFIDLCSHISMIHCSLYLYM